MIPAGMGRHGQERRTKRTVDEVSRTEASLIRIGRRDFEKAIKLPSAYVARASALGSASYDAWTRARPANDFAAMLPFLEKAVDLSREYAGFFAPYQHVADPLIDADEEGMTTALVRSLFAELRSELVPVVRAISDQPVPGDDCLRGFFSEPAQLDFSFSVVKQFGYYTDRGRLDKTHHPFCAKFSAGDVRITTRVDEKHFGDALFSTMHECGHALYEQGVAASLEGGLDREHRQACTRASRGFGKMWSVAAARSGSIFTRFSGILFQISSGR